MQFKTKCVGKAGNAINILCVGHATKNVLMDGSSEPRYQMGHMKHETKRDPTPHCFYTPISLR